MNFVAWLILCVGFYILPAGVCAFINLDWTYLDFTTWTKAARAMYAIAVVGTTAVYAIDE